MADKARVVHICSSGDNLELQRNYIEAIGSQKKTVILYEHCLPQVDRNTQKRHSKFIEQLSNSFRCETWDVIPELRTEGTLENLTAKKLEIQQIEDANDKDSEHENIIVDGIFAKAISALFGIPLEPKEAPGKPLAKPVEALIKFRKLEGELIQTQSRLRRITSDHRFICKNLGLKNSESNFFEEQSTRLQESSKKLTSEIKAHLREIRYQAIEKCIKVSLRYFDQVIVLSDFDFVEATNRLKAPVIILETPPKEIKKRPLIQPLENDLP